MANSKNGINEQESNRANSTQSSAGATADNTTGNTVKNPDDWATGDETMTGAQRSYLKTLSDEAGEELDDTLTKADASKRIDELQHKTGRGLDTDK